MPRKKSTQKCIFVCIYSPILFFARYPVKDSLKFCECSCIFLVSMVKYIYLYMSGLT